jgi:hypothetical protein
MIPATGRSFFSLSNRMSRTRAIAAIFAALFLIAEIPVARPGPVPASMSYPFTVVLDTVFQIDYHTLDVTHAWSHGRTESVREIKNHDTPSEFSAPEGQDGGYLWGMSTYWRFVERDGGTYVQSESVSLTTRVPAGLGWLIEPYIKSVPRESLEEILTDTRKGVLHPSVTCAQDCGAASTYLR